MGQILKGHRIYRTFQKQKRHLFLDGVFAFEKDDGRMLAYKSIQKNLDKFLLKSHNICGFVIQPGGETTVSETNSKIEDPSNQMLRSNWDCFSNGCNAVFGQKSNLSKEKSRWNLLN